MKKILPILSFLFLTWLPGFTQRQITTYKIPSILSQKRETILMGDYASDIRFAPLETRNECLVDVALQVVSDEGHIYLRDRSNQLGGFYWDKTKRFVLSMNNCEDETYYSIINAQDFIGNFSKSYPEMCKEMRVDNNPVILQAIIK